MTTRKITTSISTPSLSSFDINNFKNDKNSFSESSLLKHRSSLKMDTFSIKYYSATQKSNKNKLYEIINNKDSRSAFYDFLGTQFCVENLLCWEAIEKFKKMDGTPSEMYTTAEEIYSLFIRDNSRYEINIYSKQKDRLKETLKHTFIIPEFSDNGSTSSSTSSSPSSGNSDGGNALTHSFSNLSLNNSFQQSISAPTSQTNTPVLYNNIVQSSTFITNSPIQTDTFPKRKRKLRFRKLISKTIFSDPNINNNSNSNNNYCNNKYSNNNNYNINNIPPPTLDPTNQSEIIHPPLSPNTTFGENTTRECFSRTNSSNCVVGSCTDNDSFVVIFGNTIGNRKSGSAYSGSDSSDGESYEEFDRNNIKFGIYKCSNLFNDIQDELEQMMIENSLGEFLKSKYFKDRLNNNNNNNNNNNGDNSNNDNSNNNNNINNNTIDNITNSNNNENIIV